MSEIAEHDSKAPFMYSLHNRTKIVLWSRALRSHSSAKHKCQFSLAWKAFWRREKHFRVTYCCLWDVGRSVKLRPSLLSDVGFSRGSGRCGVGNGQGASKLFDGHGGSRAVDHLCSSLCQDTLDDITSDSFSSKVHAIIDSAFSRSDKEVK
uniref:RxLR effector candidate protein n=1 Tax=Hyaloperonospora arabidopsidis (strain Emoy2) TaxID=559515 RepID=M4BKF9_HYAAE